VTIDKISLETDSGPKEQSQNTPSRDLVELESTIENGLPACQEVGAALDEIHSHKLDKPQYKRFKTYPQSILILRLTQSKNHEITCELFLAS
jgi:hypothetical protein